MRVVLCWVSALAMMGCPSKGEDSEACGNGFVETESYDEECDGTIGLREPCERCTSLCKIDRTACNCGNGVREAPELCDGTDLGDGQCTALGYSGGDLGCKQDCTYDESGCFKCGNGRIDPGEQCEGQDFNGESCQSQGYQGGFLVCQDCKLWFGGCNNCGNGIKDLGDNCDGQDLGGATCESIGFLRGTLACYPNCQYDVTGCTRCGNGIAELGEGEECDGNDLHFSTCETFGFTSGTLECTPTCLYDKSNCSTCGNAIVEGAEECDGQNLNGETCQAFGYLNGFLQCSFNCHISTMFCRNCGDNMVDAFEVCDGNHLTGVTCTQLGHTGGTLACDPDCLEFDESGCTDCGDGMIQGAEQCDGQNLAGQTCASRGHLDGTLACNASCMFDESGCNDCGDGGIGPGEECDGTNLDGQTCTSLGFAGGTLSCTSTCQYTGCTAATCGDGMINAPETCEDGNLESLDGCSSTCGAETGFTCTGTGPTSCTTVCGDGAARGLEFCDDGNPTPGDGCTGCMFDGAIQAIEPDDNGVQEGVDNFSMTSPNGPIDTQNGVNVVYAGRIRGPNGEGGDDDVYRVVNSQFTANRTVRVDVYSASTGYLMPCDATADTRITVRSFTGTVADSNDNRSPTDFCSGLLFTVPAGGQMFVEVSHKNDNAVIPAYLLHFEGGVCGNGVVEVGEECDGAGGPPCMATCQRVAVCGDGFLDGAEQCDDGNVTPGDQCSATCRVESTPESEPNDDGATAVGQNDFSSANANGPYTANEIISTAISPAGDEDTFALQNPTAVPVTVTINVYNQFVGLGVSCGTATDTVLYLRDAAGNELQVNDNRSPTDRCSGMTVTIPPFTTQYLHLTENGDNGTTLALWIELDFQ